MDKQKNAAFLNKSGNLFSGFSSAITDNVRLNKTVTAALAASVLAAGLVASSAEAATPSSADKVNAGTANSAAHTQSSEKPSAFGRFKSGVLNTGRSALSSAETTFGNVVDKTEKLKTSVKTSAIVQKAGSTTEKLKTGIESGVIAQKIGSTTEKLKTSVKANSMVQKASSKTEKLKSDIESSAIAQKVGSTTGKLKTGIESGTEKATQKLENARASIGSFFKSDGYAKAGSDANHGADAVQADKVAPARSPRM